MAFELSVNLEYMFHEAGERIEDRIAAAADAGFTKVEMFTMAGREASSVAAALKAHGVEMLSMVCDPRIQIVLRDNHAAFQANFEKQAAEAQALGCSRLVVASGAAVPYMKRAVQIAAVADAVASVLDIAEAAGLTIMLEAVNTRVDHPGVLFAQTIDALAVIELVNSPRVRLLYDLYHSVTEGEDPAVMLPKVAALLEHVQVADAPGRGEPGSGSIDWPAQIATLKEIGYTGVIGIECVPTRTPTADALAEFRALCAAA